MENGSENIYISTRFYLHVHKYKTKIKSLKVQADEEDLSVKTLVGEGIRDVDLSLWTGSVCPHLITYKMSTA